MKHNSLGRVFFGGKDLILIVLQEIMRHKLVFIETQDVVETTLALDNYRRACDSGRGAVFFSVARYLFLCYTF